MTLGTTSAALGIKDVDDILNDVRASRCFGRSQRQMKLFEYLLRHSLTQAQTPPTQYSIALDVLNRPESFDAATDSIVRVEMHRLRANLESYNNSQSRYIISVPSASFDVNIVPRKTGLSGFIAAQSKKSILAGTVAIAAVSLSFAAIGSFNNAPPQACAVDRPNLAVSHGTTPSNAQDYVESVLRSTISQQSAFNLLKAGVVCDERAAPSYTVEIAMLEQGASFNLSLKVLDAGNGSIVESHHLTGELAEARPDTPLFLKLTEVANTISFSTGTAARHAYSKNWGLADYRRSYGCLIAMYDSYAGELDAQFENIHNRQ